MRILITGAGGMVGSALMARLAAIREKRDPTRPSLSVDELYPYDRGSSPEQLDAYCAQADFVFHLAGVCRPADPDELTRCNVDFTATLLQTLRRHRSTAPVMLAGSVQASLTGRYSGSAYGRSKLAGEQLVFRYGEETGVPVAVYRFPNLMGHSRPYYNSVVSTLCYAAAHDLPFPDYDRAAELELLYIDDLVEAMLDLLEGRVHRCTYAGAAVLPAPDGDYCYVPHSCKATLGEIADLLRLYQKQPDTLTVPGLPHGSLAGKLYSLYLTYLPPEKFAYPLQMHRDARGSFTELLRTAAHGQFSVSVSEPGVTRGEHWHSSKWELFVVVSGRALIRERCLSTGEQVEFTVSGDRLQAVHMIPGWTHSLLNLSDTEKLVTVLWASEPFDPDRPDTYREPV